MSAFGLHPTFADDAGYRRWRATWKRIYGRLTAEIRTGTRTAKAQQRAGSPSIQADLAHKRVMAAKAMTLLKDAKTRMGRIRAMRAQMAAQAARLPLDLGTLPSADFHYNRGHGEFPSILPVWVLKAKGEVFYLDHVEGTVRFSTREPSTGSTKGMIRFRQCRVRIEADRTAVVEPING